jgi:hypothetical protein
MLPNLRVTLFVVLLLIEKLIFPLEILGLLLLMRRQ